MNDNDDEYVFLIVDSETDKVVGDCVVVEATSISQAKDIAQKDCARFFYDCHVRLIMVKTKLRGPLDLDNEEQGKVIPS